MGLADGDCRCVGGGADGARRGADHGGVPFAEFSDNLPDGVGDRLVRLATRVKAQRKGVFIGALATTGAHDWLAALRRVLQANGLAPG